MLNRVPRRWKGNPTLLIALAGMGILTSCAREQNEPVVTGKVMVPLFLTEEDARTIARVEAQKRGVVCIGKGQTFTLFRNHLKTEKPETVQYMIDEFDKSKRVGFKFVTHENCEAVYGKGTTVTVKALANEIRNSLKSSELKERVKVIELTADIKTEDPIRKEVVEFLTWLKKQGVI